ncbi:hypothetical protein GQ600_7342 [Phytophthora cactorum]|nr:hypothetical protein GQ600_7342 [Phytophthora cactorum]
MNTDAVEVTLTTIAGECVLVPISCNSNHWCSIMIDIRKHGRKISRAYLRIGHGVQLDSYNCGLFVLLAFEHVTGVPSVGRMDKKLLMYLRYRYLSLCLH